MNYITNYAFPKEKAAPYFPFTINDIRDGTSYYKAPVHPHTHAYYELFLIERGGGLHIIDEVSYPMTDRTVHILQPGVPHFVQRDDHTRGCVVVFTLDVLKGDSGNLITESLVSFFRSTLSQPSAVLSSRAFAELMTLVRLMKADGLAGMQGGERQAYVRSLFAAFLLPLKPNFSIGHKGGQGDMLCMANKFHELVDKYYNEGLSIADYAARIGTTEKTLTRAVKKHTANTPAQLVRERVIVEASRLLQHTTYSVKEIAYHLHFSDPAHFIKVFRQDKNCTPLEYRRLMLR